MCSPPDSSRHGRVWLQCPRPLIAPLPFICSLTEHMQKPQRTGTLPLTELHAQSRRRSRLQGPEWGGGICVWAECEPREQPIRNVGAPLFCFPNPKMTVKTLEGAAPRDVNKTLQVESMWCVRQPGQAGRELLILAHFPFILSSQQPGKFLRALPLLSPHKGAPLGDSIYLHLSPSPNS